MSAQTKLKRTLGAWDGKSRNGIEAVFDAWHKQRGFAAMLLPLCREPKYQTGATWLLKHAMESKRLTGTDVEKQLLRQLHDLVVPEAQLHVLQIFDRLSIPGGSARAAERFARRCIESTNKFVSAWGYSAFHALADQHPRFRDEAVKLLEMGARDGPASTRARIRRLEAKGFKDTVSR